MEMTYQEPWGVSFSAMSNRAELLSSTCVLVVSDWRTLTSYRKY